MLLPGIVRGDSIVLFLFCFCLVISLYGGGFATIPAYLADIFGTRMVGAIHGRLLTAWSAAGILGPVLVNYLREYQLAAGLSGGDIYRLALYILAGLLVTGLVCNCLVRPVEERYAMSMAEKENADSAYLHVAGTILCWRADRDTWPLTLISWVMVLIPLGWGVSIALSQTLKLFS